MAPAKRKRKPTAAGKNKKNPKKQKQGKKQQKESTSAPATFNLPCPDGFCLTQELLDKGLEHVLEQIYSYLDSRAVANCLLVSRGWNALLRQTAFKSSVYRVSQCRETALSSARPIMVDIARGPSTSSVSENYFRYVNDW